MEPRVVAVRVYSYIQELALPIYHEDIAAS